MKKQTLEQYLSLLTLGLIVLVAVFSPLLFDNAAASRFELPRLILLWVSVAALIWLGGMRQLLRGPEGTYLHILDWPGSLLLLWVAVVAASTFLSTNLLSSLLGHHGRLSGGLLGTIALVALAFVVRWHFRAGKDTRFLFSLVVVVGVVQAVLGFLQSLGVDFLGLTQGNAVAVGTLGSISGFGWMGILTFWTALFLSLGQESVQRRLLWLGAALIGFWSLGSAHSTELWLVFLVSVVIGGALVWQRLKKDKTEWSWMAGLFGAALLIALLTSSTLFGVGETPGSRQILPTSLGWHVAATVARDNPLLGSGPETFESSMLLAKTIDFNIGAGWSFTNVVASNEYFSQLANLGYLGLLVFLLLLLWLGRAIVAYIRQAQAKSVAQNFDPAILWLVGTALYWLFFGMDSVTAVFFWLSVGLLLVAARGGDEAEVKIPARQLSANEKQSLGFMLIGGAVSVILILSFGMRWQRADRAFYAQTQAGQDDLLKAYEEAQKAQKLLPWVDYYQTAFTYRALDLLTARQQALGESPTEAEQKEFSQYAGQRLEEATAATTQALKVNPERASNWAAKGDTQMVATGGEGSEEVIKTYAQALVLDPLSPRYAFALGGLYENQKDKNTALQYYGRASDAKPDWWVARYKLALLLEGFEQPSAAFEQMQIVAQLIEGDQTLDEQTRTQITDDLARIKAAAEAAEAAAAADSTEGAPLEGASGGESLTDLAPPELDTGNNL